MNQPCIFITRHQPGAYEWAVCFDQEKLGGDLPVSSIEACLDGALASLPESNRLIEIRYRGVHMGTYPKDRIEDDADEVATSIAETYAMLMDAN